mmetsp:Transcript_593/g.1374  ORF Transcript_593/g.1374 Transcript_593/m.1374 type:complete len:884 (+) Transcript_593:108-2759(+)
MDPDSSEEDDAVAQLARRPVTPVKRQQRRLSSRISIDDAPAEGDVQLRRCLKPKEKTDEVRRRIFDGIKQNRFCRLLADSDVETIIATMEHFEFQPGETVVTQGQSGKYFFVLDVGALEVRVDNVVKNIMGPLSGFGAIALMHNCPRTATVVAKDVSSVWGADGGVFREVLQEHAREHSAENRSLLDGVRLFDGLSSEQKERVGKLAVFSLAFDAGSRPVSEGDPPAALYVVRKGELKVVKGGALAADGSFSYSNEVVRLSAGDSFGEHAVLYGEPHEATLLAETACELVGIGLQQLKDLLGGDVATCLERRFIISVLKQMPLLSHFSITVHRIADIMGVKSLKPEDKLEQDLQLVVVINGELSGTEGDKPVVLHRSQWYEGNAMAQLEEVGQAEKRGSSLCGVTVGPTGCRVALLTREGLMMALKELGLSAISNANDALSCMRKLLLAKKVPIFRELSEAQIDGFVAAFVMKRYRRGALVIRQGDVGDAFFVLASGDVAIMMDGKRVRTLGRNACFGERALLFAERRSASVEVVSEEAELWSVSKNRFQEVVTKNMREELAHRIRLQDTTVTLRTLRHVRLVGAGSFGSVRLVEHKFTGLRYALKRIRKKDGKIPTAVESEIGILSCLDHPFILRMVTTFEKERSIYILTELVAGGQLYDLMNFLGVSLTRKQAQFVIGTLVLALEELHDHNIVYRDLKPENVMLDMQGYLKLIDFGISKKLDKAHARTYTSCGTIFYMAPEIIRGKGHGTAVDIWSLGVMFYDFVCGYLPFGDDEEDQHAILGCILEDELEFKEYSDNAGKTLMKGLLVKVPEKRLGTGINGWEDVKSQKYFKLGVQGLFSKIIGRELSAPFVPEAEKYSDEAKLNQIVTLSDADDLCKSD